MAITIKSFDEVYNLLKNRLQSQFIDADFKEGSFNDVLFGSVSLAYQQIQSLLLDRFSKTFFDNSLTIGDDLELLAIDRFGEGASRPQPSIAFGIIEVTRTSDNTEDIVITSGTEVTNGNIKFTVKSDVTIGAAIPSGNVVIEALETGIDGNIAANNSAWEISGVEDVTITNVDPLQGGANLATDEEYKDFIKEFVQSIKDGTADGLEGTARRINGVSDARIIRRLVDVGTLDSSGNLETGNRLYKFKTVAMILYVSGVGGAANAELLRVVKEKVEEQLSSGEFLDIQASGIIPVDITVTITFKSTSEAIELSQNPTEIRNAIINYINTIAIGENFDVSNFQSNFAALNGYSDEINTFIVSTPTGDIVTSANEKLVARDITINL